MSGNRPRGVSKKIFRRSNTYETKRQQSLDDSIKSLASTISNCWRGVVLLLLLAFSIAALLLLGGCSFVRPLQVDAAPLQVARPPQHSLLPDPRPVDLLDIHWVVVTDQEQPALDEWALLCLTAKDYENLSKNTAEMARWATEIRWQLDQYKATINK